MDGVTLAMLGGALLLLLLALRVPIAFALLFSGILGMVAIGAMRFGNFNLELGWRGMVAALSRDPYSFIASFSLMAIPMFLLMGNFAFHGGITKDAYNSARVWLSRLPGGLAISTIAACALFAAISGSSLATCAALGRIAVPEMLRSGYNRGLAAGTVAAGGTLGALIPPSILLIVYGVFAGQSVGKLLIAGFVPGILTALSYAIMIWLRVLKNPELAPRSEQRYSRREKLQAIGGTWQFLLIFMIVMGAMYGGLATPTEAAAIGAIAVLGVGWMRRRLTMRTTVASVRETVQQSAMIFAIALGAKILASFIALSGVSHVLAEWAAGIEGGRIYVILGLCLVYLLLGMFIDPMGILLLTLPLSLPIVSGLGYDLIWFGIILVKLLEIGMITPPVGLNVFVLNAAIGNRVGLEETFRGIGWFLVADFIVMAIMISSPELVLWLPELAFS